MADSQGSLIVVGSGIKSVGHLTLEARGWIEQSDIVVYCVADPATEVWIRKHSRVSFDLYTLYGNDKKRIDTYNDMVQVMLDNVRAGRDTCAVFYGHPGVFVLPTHKAISILRSEGYPAAMLPAISALDCLWADVGVDPSAVGCQEFEATDLLLRKRPLATESHVVIWQIGCVGDAGFNFAGYDNRNLGVLVDYLEEFYPPSHGVVHYQGSQYPMCPSRCDRMTLEDLRHAPVTGISTLYMPPATRRTTDVDMAVRLGLVRGEGAIESLRAAEAKAAEEGPVPSAPKPRPTAPRRSVTPPASSASPAPSAPPVPVSTSAVGSTAATTSANGSGTPASTASTGSGAPVSTQAAAPRQDANRKFLDEIRRRRRSTEARYKATLEENPLADYIAEMMQDPRVLAAFLRDPESCLGELPALSDDQRKALLSRHPGRIRLAMKEPVEAVPSSGGPSVPPEPAPSSTGRSVAQ
ncbi:MAG: SAM-dependent methyltransferase [Acidobacteriota bacterium]